jgi:glutamate N-acetyltransferase/amino-acid N-acetyltransferase
LSADGEGVSRFVTVRVNGARSQQDADVAARAVANSALVKTSWCGGDPNWGRIIDALGYSAAEVVESKVDIAYSPPGSRKLLYSLKRGRPTNASFAALCKVAALSEFDLHINLNLGKGAAVIYAADLTEHYVDFNKGDVTDPSVVGRLNGRAHLQSQGPARSAALYSAFPEPDFRCEVRRQFHGLT